MTLAYALAAHFADDPLPSSHPFQWEERTADVVVDDATLFASVARGDAVAFEALFRRYRGTLCRFVFRYTQSMEMAEDLVHDLFLWVWRQAADVDLRGSVRGYLFGAARHRAFDAVERRAVAERAPIADVEASLMHREASPDTLVEGAELRAAVHAAIAHLSERRRTVITLRWGHQLSFADIAQALGVSVRTAETTHLRAMEDLRRWLGGVLQE